LIYNQHDECVGKIEFVKFNEYVVFRFHYYLDGWYTTHDYKIKQGDTDIIPAIHTIVFNHIDKNEFIVDEIDSIVLGVYIKGWMTR